MHLCSFGNYSHFGDWKPAEWSIVRFLLNAAPFGGSVVAGGPIRN